MNAITAFESTSSEQVSPTSAAPCVRIIGCGRDHRRDDQLGLRVVEHIPPAFREGVQILTSEAPGAELLLDLDQCELLIIVDAAVAGPRMRPGEWTRIDVGRSSEVRVSPVTVEGGEPTHFLGVNTALALGADLGVLPPDVWVYVIAGEDFGFGEALSPGLVERARDLADCIKHDVERWLDCRSRVHA